MGAGSKSGKRRERLSRGLEIALRLFLLSALALGTLLACAPEGGHTGGGTGDASGTTARTDEKASTAGPPDVAEAAAAEVDEPSIRAHLAHLTGASPAPIGGREVTISERGSADGRRTAAEYMES